MNGPGIHKLLHAVPLLLDRDTIEYMDWLGKRLSEQWKRDVSRSEVCRYIFQRHYIKTQKRALDKKHKAKVDTGGKVLSA